MDGLTHLIEDVDAPEFDPADDTCCEFDSEILCPEMIRQGTPMSCWCAQNYVHDGPHICASCKRQSPFDMVSGEAR